MNSTATWWHGMRWKICWQVRKDASSLSPQKTGTNRKSVLCLSSDSSRSRSWGSNLNASSYFERWSQELPPAVWEENRKYRKPIICMQIIFHCGQLRFKPAGWLWEIGQNVPLSHSRWGMRNLGYAFSYAHPAHLRAASRHTNFLALLTCPPEDWETECPGAWRWWYRNRQHWGNVARGSGCTETQSQLGLQSSWKGPVGTYSIIYKVLTSKWFTSILESSNPQRSSYFSTDLENLLYLVGSPATTTMTTRSAAAACTSLE